MVYRSTAWLIALILVLVASGSTVSEGQPLVVAAQRGASPETAAADAPTGLGNQVYLPYVSRQEQQTSPGSIFGVQMYAPFNTSGAAVDLARSAQVSWSRWPIKWGQIEPQPTTPEFYQWGATDASLQAANSAGIAVIATIDVNPSWAAQYPSGPIDRAGNAAFVEFVGALVERYDGDGWKDAPDSPIVNYWEFYNEPDGGSELMAQYGGSIWGIHGVEYAKLLCDVYPVIKNANPDAKIVLGGLAYDYFIEDGGVFVRSFLDDVLSAGGGQCMDVMNFHYYPFFEAEWTAYGPGLSGKTNYLRSKLASYGLGNLPFVVTESGHHSNAHPEQPSSPEMQSAYVVKLFTQAISSDIQAMTWFSWYDLPDYWAATGLLTADRSPKPSYYAFRVARNNLGNSVFQRRLDTGETGSAAVEAYLFQGVDPIYVLWVDGTTNQQVRLPGRYARVSDSLNTTLAKLADADDQKIDGMITVTASPMPIYVDILEQ